MIGFYPKFFLLGLMTGIGSVIVHRAWFGGQLGWPCPLKYWIGIPCPGWGMTRSLTATIRGDLSTALHFHGLGPIILLIGGIIFLHIGYELITGQRLRVFYVDWLHHPQFWLGGLGVYLSYHALRLALLAQSGELRLSFAQSPLGQYLLHH